MRKEHLVHLRCPKTLRKLVLRDEQEKNGRIRSGILLEPVSGNTYPVVGFIPRFVPVENYASNFGLQWNIHNRTQYDETSGAQISRERFEKETKWPHDLRGELMLEVGSGSGRFTKHAADTGAMVISLDFSNAVEANYNQNGQRENILIVQAGVVEMPFEKEYFDKAFCFGVLQHTPDPRESFMALVAAVKKGGRLASDIYIKNFTHWVLGAKYYVRPFIRNVAPEKLYRSVQKYINFMWPLVRIISKIPKIGYALNWRLLVADYSTVLPNASDEQLKEWAILDTFDMLSPVYDKPATVRTFRRWHEEAGLTEIDVHEGYNGVEGRGRRPGGQV